MASDKLTDAAIEAIEQRAKQPAGLYAELLEGETSTAADGSASFRHYKELSSAERAIIAHFIRQSDIDRETLLADRRARIAELAAVTAERDAMHAEVLAVLVTLGDQAVRVREGGGPENIAASLAVTTIKLSRAKDAAESALAAREVEVGRLREALELLESVQNGCPLYKYEADWNRAMAMADTLLRPNTEPRP